MGRPNKGFQALSYMLKQGCFIPDNLLLSLLDQGLHLNACQLVHYSMCVGCPGSVCISGPLIRSLASLHSLLDANLVFCQVSNPTVHTWQAIIYAHFVNGESALAIEIYHRMVASTTQPNRFIFSCVLRACASTSDYLNGMLVHDHVITCGLHKDVVLGSTLIDMYAKCGIMMSAMAIFDRLQNRNIVSWNALMNGYVRNEESQKALKLFQAMQVCVGTIPNKVTLLCVMMACGEVEDLKRGRGVHMQLIILGLDIDINIANTLIDMYAKCRCMEDAFFVLQTMPIRNVVSWSAIINGAVRCGVGLSVFPLYDQMVHEGNTPDRVILIGLLNACAHAKDKVLGSRIHDQILERGFGTHLVVRGALIDMYAKCNMLNDAQRVFEKTLHKSLMIWGLMITGYAQHGEGMVALELYEKMIESQVKPDKFLFSALLNVCGDLAAFEQGKTLYDQMGEYQVEPDTVIGNALIDMYGKCGDFEKACKVFDGLPYRDDVSLRVMLTLHARQHSSKRAMQCYGGMQECRMRLDEPCHTGLVSAYPQDRSWLQPCADPVSLIMRHYTSVVEFLACVGQLEVAAKILQTMPVSPNTIHWRSLLSRCRGHGNSQLAQHCMRQITQLHSSYDPQSKLCLVAFRWNHAGMCQLSSVPETSCHIEKADFSESLVYDEHHSILVQFDPVEAKEECKQLKLFLENHKHLTYSKNYHLEDCFYFLFDIENLGSFSAQEVGNNPYCSGSKLRHKELILVC